MTSIACRYRPAGHFARHYVAGKLRHDPVWPALQQLGREEHFGDVVDIGCGRGHFAAALLEAGLARSVLGLDVQQSHLEQARAAMQGLAFSARRQDFSSDTTVPPADTVLLIDVVYQLESEAQIALLQHAAQAARRRLILRTADPASGFRSAITRFLERIFRPVWPHSGRLVNARSIGDLVAIIEACGMRCVVTPCWSGTPFSNVLIIGKKGVLF